MENIFETMSLCDLEKISLILKQKLLVKEKWRDSQRGYNLELYNQRDLLYRNDENHIKLKKINQYIEDLLNRI